MFDYVDETEDKLLLKDIRVKLKQHCKKEGRSELYKCTSFEHSRIQSTSETCSTSTAYPYPDPQNNNRSIEQSKQRNTTHHSSLPIRLNRLFLHRTPRQLHIQIRER